MMHETPYQSETLPTRLSTGADERPFAGPHGAASGLRRATQRVQAPGNFTRHTVHPDEVQPGDWLRDLGTLRQVVSIEELPASGSPARIFIARFASRPGVEDLALGIPTTVTVTLWRQR